jgi:small ligand-binding sensory domain FIST
VGLGVCATGVEYLDTPAVVAMTGDFDPGSYRLFSIDDEASAAGADLGCGDAQPAFAVVHGNPARGDIERVVSACAARVDSGYLIGGLTSSRRRNLQLAGELREPLVSGVAFSDGVVIATRLTQGCTPIGKRHTITQAQRNVVLTLDGRPALEVLKEDVGSQSSEDIARLGGTIFAGLGVAGSDTGDYIVRHLIGIDPANQLIAVADMVKAGGQLLFCRRDRETARDDMERMLKSIRQGLYGRPRGGLYYSCLGRGQALFGEHGELAMIGEALGDVPIIGFFCNGEISHNRLYGYTGVLTLFV